LQTLKRSFSRIQKRKTPKHEDVEREPNIFKKLPNEDIKEIIRMTDLRGTEQLNTNDTLQSTYSSSEKKQPFSLI